MNRTAKISMLLAPLAAAVLAVGAFFSIPGGRDGINHMGLGWPASGAAVDAVPVKAPDARELVELNVRDVIPILEANTHAVVLVSSDEKTLLPIFVSEEAAVSIAFRLAHQDSPHPLAADLLDDVVATMGGKVTEVQIDDVRDDIYTSHVVIRQGDRDHKVEARPSDAIAMALSGDAKIVVTQKVLAQAGIAREEIEKLREQMGVGGGGMGPGMPDDEFHNPPGGALPADPGGSQIEL